MRGISGLLFLSAMFTVGCAEPKNPIIEETRERLLGTALTEEPQAIATTLEQYADGQRVTIAGRIYGREASPFDAQEARFTIIELPEPGHSHDDPNDCPFCKRKREQAALAMVQICDAAGKPIQMSADALLNLEANQDIAVSGISSMVGELIVVQADGLQVLDEATATELSERFNAQPE